MHWCYLDCSASPGYDQDGQVVMDAAAVRRHYMRTYLVLDVVRGLAAGGVG